LPKILTDYEAIAQKFGGRILSMGQRVDDPSKWRCGRGHTFDRSYSSILSGGSFCPTCSASLAERICGEVLKHIFGKPFKKVKIRDLRGLGGGCLEFDFYNKKLKVALEHHGPHHYRPIRKWGGEKQLTKQQRHDELRRDYCRKNGITLIEIRELGDKTKVDDLGAEIQRQCAEAGIITKNASMPRASLSAISLKTREELKYEEMKTAAVRLSFELLTPTYLGVNASHSFRCVEGHEFNKSLKLLQKAKGCPVCRQRKRLIPVVLSDGRMFESLEEAARALQSQGSYIKKAANFGLRCRGLQCALITREQFEEFGRHPKRVADFCHRQFKILAKPLKTRRGG
jgi:hypothetical protein